MYPYHIFCSYQWKCQKLVTEVCDRLRNDANYDIWLDIRGGMDVGDDVFKEMEKGIRDSRLFLAFITKDYATESDNCKKEIKYANALRRRCIYVMLERDLEQENLDGIGLLIASSYRLNAYDEPDCLTRLSDKAYGTLLSAIEAKLNNKEPPTPKFNFEGRIICNNKECNKKYNLLLNIPKKVDCGKVFCASCTKSQADQETFKCPLDGETHYWRRTHDSQREIKILEYFESDRVATEYAKKVNAIDKKLSEAIPEGIEIIETSEANMKSSFGEIERKLKETIDKCIEILERFRTDYFSSVKKNINDVFKSLKIQLLDILYAADERLRKENRIDHLKKLVNENTDALAVIKTNVFQIETTYERDENFDLKKLENLMSIVDKNSNNLKSELENFSKSSFRLTNSISANIASVRSKRVAPLIELTKLENEFDTFSNELIRFNAKLHDVSEDICNRSKTPFAHDNKHNVPNMVDNFENKTVIDNHNRFKNVSCMCDFEANGHMVLFNDVDKCFHIFKRDDFKFVETHKYPPELKTNVVGACFVRHKGYICVLTVDGNTSKLHLFDEKYKLLKSAEVGGERTSTTRQRSHCVITGSRNGEYRTLDYNSENLYLIDKVKNSILEYSDELELRNSHQLEFYECDNTNTLLNLRINCGRIYISSSTAGHVWVLDAQLRLIKTISDEIIKYNYNENRLPIYCYPDKSNLGIIYFNNNNQQALHIYNNEKFLDKFPFVGNKFNNNIPGGCLINNKLLISDNDSKMYVYDMRLVKLYYKFVKKEDFKENEND